jgi:hypothetical protein
MPPKKDSFWERSLESLKARNPAWGAGRFRQALEQLAAKLGREDAPGDRWVGNYLNKLKGDHDWPQREIEYRSFSWPESMGTPDLPWEASESALELLEVHRKANPFLRHLESQPELPFADNGRQPLGMRWGHRPSVRLTRWYWRVTQAARDLPAETQTLVLLPPIHIHILGRYDIAVVLAEWEDWSDAPQSLQDSVEAYLTYAPWRSTERAMEYMAEVKRGRIPGLTPQDLFSYENLRHGISEDLKREIFGKEGPNG